jgi:hypothetical protein
MKLFTVSIMSWEQKTFLYCTLCKTSLEVTSSQESGVSRYVIIRKLLQLNLVTAALASASNTEWYQLNLPKTYAFLPLYERHTWNNQFVHTDIWHPALTPLHCMNSEKCKGTSCYPLCQRLFLNNKSDLEHSNFLVSRKKCMEITKTLQEVRTSKLTFFLNTLRFSKWFVFADHIHFFLS